MTRPSANSQHSYNVALVHLWETRNAPLEKVGDFYRLPQSIQYARMLVDALREIHGDEIHREGKQYLKAAKAHAKELS